MQFFGELAALSTAICWSFGTILFGYAGRRVGSFAINTIRITLAALLLVAGNLLIEGQILPASCNYHQLLILAISGIIGLTIGDGCYFKSLVILGPRISSLMTASSPIFAVIIAWIFVGQQMSLLDLLGIALTLAGISWVILERSRNSFGAQAGPKALGYLLGIGGSLAQAIALTMAKVGMGDNIPPLNASFVRMVSATVAIWIIVFATGRLSNIRRAVRDGKAMTAICSAAVIGPFFGIWLSLLSVQYTKIGIASTLMATTPLFIIPLVMIIHKERPSLRAIIGTITTVAGVAILLLF
ncbi:MAG: DMT family transporter [candidate division Zixibacteria bacterium]|nr:DMT family transporter [candidate division Zixibacteria bacterium]